MKPTRKTLRHETPFWVGGVFPECYFITICTRPRGINQLAIVSVWDELQPTLVSRNKRNLWSCRLFLAMPDHIHALILFDGAKRMSEVIKDWKRWIARTLNIKWQDGYFDHRLRSQDSLIQKRSYILDNPVRAGLCDKAEDWPFRVTW